MFSLFQVDFIGQSFKCEDKTAERQMVQCQGTTKNGSVYVGHHQSGESMNGDYLNYISNKGCFMREKALKLTLKIT